MLLLSTELLFLAVCCIVVNSAAVSDIIDISPAVPLLWVALVEKLSIELLFLFFALNASAVDAF